MSTSHVQYKITGLNGTKLSTTYNAIRLRCQKICLNTRIIVLADCVKPIQIWFLRKKKFTGIYESDDRSSYSRLSSTRVYFAVLVEMSTFPNNCRDHAHYTFCAYIYNRSKTEWHICQKHDVVVEHENRYQIRTYEFSRIRLECPDTPCTCIYRVKLIWFTFYNELERIFSVKILIHFTLLIPRVNIHFIYNNNNYIKSRIGINPLRCFMWCHT